MPRSAESTGTTRTVTKSEDEGNSKIGSGASTPNSDTQSRAQTPESGKDASTLENGVETLWRSTAGDTGG